MLLPEMETAIFFFYNFLVQFGSDAQQKDAVMEVSVTGAPALVESWQGLCQAP